ncbi:MAG TPA: hypothetical protein DC017_18715, partial [Candidatus Wallbacteria bacterium]|nr:hypothetical protein [Candidatus Wallbacteria bacterium]
MLNDAFIKFKEEMARRGLRVADKIGEGGMGSVYEAFDEALERRAAVKIMRADAGGSAWRERFRREAKFAAKIVHPGVAQVYQAGELESLLYYVMEFVDGEPLSAFLKKARFIESHKNDAEDLIAAGYIKRPDPNMPYFLRDLISPPLADPLHLGRIDELIAAIADILAAVHALDSVHRDIKPSNIMISSDGRVKLVDFGLVKQAVDGDITQANQFVGTFDYMAPEQFRGKNAKISPAGDIYSLGVVYYELAALVKPFEGDDIASLVGAIASKAAVDPREHNEKISAARARIILKCLAKDPSERFASAGELASAIKDLKNAPAANIIDGIKSFFFGLFSSGVEEEPAFSASEGFDATARERRTAVSEPAGREKSQLADKTEVRSAADKTKISRTLFEEAREEYFKNFVTAAVQEKLKQSYDIDSNNIDALLLYFLFLNHGIITRPEFEQKLKLSRESESA